MKDWCITHFYVVDETEINDRMGQAIVSAAADFLHSKGLG